MLEIEKKTCENIKNTVKSNRPDFSDLLWMRHPCFTSCIYACMYGYHRTSLVNAEEKLYCEQGRQQNFSWWERIFIDPINLFCHIVNKNNTSYPFFCF